MRAPGHRPHHPRAPRLARLSAETTKLRLNAGIILLSLHKPLDIAEQLATIDIMSNGRVIFGAALGNLLRGVPIDQAGNFFLALWTDFRIGGTVGILACLSITVGVLSLAALSMHRSLWGALMKRWRLGSLAQRAR